MSRTLHAFKSYKVKIDMGENYEIHYEDDEDYDIALGNWHYIYSALQYAEYLIGMEIDIPMYDWLDDAYEVHENEMILTDSGLFIRGLEAVINNINQLHKNENPLIDGHDWYLYNTDENQYGAFDKQKEEIIWYAEKLLKWSKQGLYFVEERN
ncbi:hypothetical protein B2H86_14560 [Clostridium botulinum]|uniref:hypothetical protein n=1 Tax=Clostridium botulinum TaxID=1491 RepID=UPI000A177685|nr:hypothetical protein [Clostridium botulinum]OSA73573.1 hypothetical protein B2H86_14560 [Clostridium botulinum]